MKGEIYGYAGKILRIDLTTGKFTREPTKAYAKKWLGQRGIGQRILYEELHPWVHVYEPANIVVVETGPLSGTLAPASTRYSLSSKNPYSGGVGTSNSCGFFGPELKYAGYDHLVIRGRSQRLAYLWIKDDQIELRDAGYLQGKTTWETEDLIREELGDEEIKIICIGPAGEHLARSACVIADKSRAAGKCGMGAIWGAKNLKAIAVRGTGAVEVAEPERFIEVVKRFWKRISSSSLLKSYSKYGTTAGIVLSEGELIMPYKNFQETSIPAESMKNIDLGGRIFGYKIRDGASLACPVHCSKIYEIIEGPYAGLITEGLQWQSVSNWAGKCAVDYGEALIKIETYCNQMGVDMDGSAGVISWAMECFQRGIISEKDTYGLKLEWGDHQLILELIRKLSYREGFGNILAEGSKRASDMIGRGSGYYAIHQKGQDLYEEPRDTIAWGLGACVATRAGGHTTGAPGCEIPMLMFPEKKEVGKNIFGINNIDIHAYEDKPELVRYFEREQEIINSLGMCMFVGTWYDPELLGIPELAELYSAATGWETSPEEMARTADRILNLEKAFNLIHAGLGRKDDFPPERCLKEPISSGPRIGFTYSEEKWNKLLDHYYEIHGWDKNTGFPTKSCLEKLGISEVADDLEKVGKLGIADDRL